VVRRATCRVACADEEADMQQLDDLADDRLLNGCTYCDSMLAETRDHVPSRILLDQPYPKNLPAVPACRECNNTLSRDEEYFAALIECAVAGSTQPEKLRRDRVAGMLRRSPALQARIEAAKYEVDGLVHFHVEDHRIDKVVRKLALGHAAFELSVMARDEPTSFVWKPLHTLTAAERDAFEAPHEPKLFGEVGSRGMQRTVVAQAILSSTDGNARSLNIFMNDWIEVQEGRYRYFAVDDSGGAAIRIVIGEFLACEVFWRVSQ
jgi:hypothetical protein